MAPVCASQKYRRYYGNLNYSAYCHYSLLPSVPSDFTGTIAGNQHYSTRTIEGPLPCPIDVVAQGDSPLRCRPSQHPHRPQQVYSALCRCWTHVLINTFLLLPAGKCISTSLSVTSSVGLCYHAISGTRTAR